MTPVTADAKSRPCLCVQKHSPKVNRTQLHHVWPMGMGGPDVPSNVVPLCPTTHSEVHLIMERFVRAKAHVARRRSESEYAYRLATEGWNKARQGS